MGFHPGARRNLEALHPWCLGVCWVETGGKQKSIGGPWTNLSKSSSHPKVYECRICILLEVYPSPKLPCFIWESLVSPSWQNKDQLYCHCSSLSLLEVGESSSPKWQNRKNHPLDLDDYTVHHPKWSRSTSLSLQVPSMSFHPLLTWCFGRRWFRNPGSSIGTLEYPKFTPKHQAPNHFSTYWCHGNATPKGWFLPPSNVVASPKAPRTSSRISFTMPSYFCENSDGMAIVGEIH